MEGVCCVGAILALIAGARYAVGYAAAETRRRPAGRPVPQRPAPVPVRPSAADRKRGLVSAQARLFQTALLQLGQAPDFRRAATVAAAATLVPAGFRRRQFARFRPQFVLHFRRCRAAGTGRDLLLESLRDLVTALGVAAFEAEYICTAAEGRVRPVEAAPSPADRVAALRRDHEIRLAAIRQGVGQDADLRDQLVEAEDQRYRDSLLALFDDQSGAAGSTA